MICARSGRWPYIRSPLRDTLLSAHQLRNPESSACLLKSRQCFDNLPANARAVLIRGELPDSANDLAAVRTEVNRNETHHQSATAMRVWRDSFGIGPLCGDIGTESEWVDRKDYLDTIVAVTLMLRQLI
jgi:hypothetical protein